MDHNESAEPPIQPDAKPANHHSPKTRKPKDLIMLKMTNSNEFGDTYLSK